MSSRESLSEPIELLVTPEHESTRLDWYLARQFPSYSRTCLRRAINANAVRVDGRRTKAAHRVTAGERVTIVLPALPREGPVPEDLPLTILYEDEWLAAIDKPAGMVVHPARGHWTGTLTSALQFHLERLSAAAGPTRPGIVHRLDRDTSGVMVIAKTEHAHWNLAAQFQNRLVSKEYLAIVAGGPPHDRDRIDRPIGPHPHQREKMAVRRDHRASRPAQTDYETLRRFDGFSSVRAVPQTGRTHQIRVHLASIGCPVLCDRMYGGRSRLTLGEIRRVPDDETVVLARQALHASKLKLAHPATGKPLEFKAPFPDDLGRVLAEMEKYRA